MKLLAASTIFLLATYLILKAILPDSSLKTKKKMEIFKLINSIDDHTAEPRAKKLSFLKAFQTFMSLRFDSSLYGQRLKMYFEQNIKNISWSSFRTIVIASLLLLPPASAFITSEPAVIPLSTLAATLTPFALIKHLGEREQAVRLRHAERVASEVSIYLKCGVTLSDAIRMCFCDLENLCPSSFRLLTNMLSSGKSPEEAFLAYALKIGSRDLELIARTCLVSLNTGSELSNVMSAIGEAVRERSSLRRELETATLQGRLSGLIVALLPFMFLALSIALTKNTAHVIFATPAGLLMLTAATALDTAGFLWIRKILHIRM